MFNQFVDDKLVEMQSPNFVNKGDFLTILLQDPLTKDNRGLIIDECIDFYFAGSQSTSVAVENLIMYTMQPRYNHYMEDIRVET